MQWDNPDGSCLFVEMLAWVQRYRYLHVSDETKVLFDYWLSCGWEPPPFPSSDALLPIAEMTTQQRRSLLMGAFPLARSAFDVHPQVHYDLRVRLKRGDWSWLAAWWEAHQGGFRFFPPPINARHDPLLRLLIGCVRELLFYFVPVSWMEPVARYFSAYHLSTTVYGLSWNPLCIHPCSTQILEGPSHVLGIPFHFCGGGYQQACRIPQDRVVVSRFDRPEWGPPDTDGWYSLIAERVPTYITIRDNPRQRFYLTNYGLFWDLPVSIEELTERI